MLDGIRRRSVLFLTHGSEKFKDEHRTNNGPFVSNGLYGCRKPLVKCCMAK